MGYSISTDVVPRNRTPRFSSCTRKSVARRLRLQERGQRFYSAILARWISRDPLSEIWDQSTQDPNTTMGADRNALNLYGMCSNDPVTGFDVLGLWLWLNGRRQGEDRAHLIAQQFDSAASLAPKAAMEASESELWLQDSMGKPVKPTDTIHAGCRYTVPNIVFVYRQSSYPPYFQWATLRDWNALDRQGYKVVYGQFVSRSTFTGDLKNPDIFGVSMYGHGSGGYKGYLQFYGPPRMLTPPFVKPHHKLGGLKLGVCWAGALDWGQHVSKYGWYWGKDTWVWVWDLTAISIGFPYPSP
jgi:RHS repeat-associated protein